MSSDKKEERAIRKVMKSSNVSKGQAIAILKDKGVLKQKKGKKGLKIRGEFNKPRKAAKRAAKVASKRK